MTDSLLVWIVAAVLLGLDLLAAAVKASLSYARLPYLMSLRREGREAQVEPDGRRH